MMHEPINVKSPNNTSKWQMEFNSAFKGLVSYDVPRHLDFIIRMNDLIIVV
jgi:hypothetical protein